jgi:hypothetical protein
VPQKLVDINLGLIFTWKPKSPPFLKGDLGGFVRG